MLNEEIDQSYIGTALPHIRSHTPETLLKALPLRLLSLFGFQIPILQAQVIINRG